MLRGELRHRARDIWRALIGYQLLPADAECAVGHEFLKVALADDIMRSRRLAFRIIALIEGGNVAQRVDKSLRFGTTRARGDALEILSHLGDREAASLLVLPTRRAR